MTRHRARFPCCLLDLGTRADRTTPMKSSRQRSPTPSLTGSSLPMPGRDLSRPSAAVVGGVGEALLRLIADGRVAATSVITFKKGEVPELTLRRHTSAVSLRPLLRPKLLFRRRGWVTEFALWQTELRRQSSTTSECRQSTHPEVSLGFQVAPSSALARVANVVWLFTGKAMFCGADAKPCVPQMLATASRNC
jgi:hypothetical protein